MTALTVSLQLPAELATELTKHTGLLAYVLDAYPAIESADVASFAAVERKNCLTVAKVIKEKMDKYTAPAEAIIDQARADFKPAIDNAKAAADHLGVILLGWDAKEKARIEDLRRAQEEENRKARAKAEQEAAIARAKADSEATERRRQAAAAEEAQRAALAAGNAKEAAKAAAEAAKRQEQARAAEEQAQADAERRRAETEAAIAAAAPVEATKVDGFGGRSNWKAELDAKSEQEAIRLIVAAFQTHPEYVAYLCLDWKALHSSSKSLKANFNVPGIKARNIPIAVSR